MKQSVCLILIAVSVVGGTSAERTIDRPEQWSGEIILDETVVIKKATVTVAAGTTISALPGAGITLAYEGRLEAIGTEQAPITMSGQTNTAIRMQGGSLRLEHCSLEGWQREGQHKDQSNSISGSVGDKGTELIRCRLNRCGTIRLALKGTLEVRDCEFRGSGGVSVHGKGGVTIVGNTLRGGTLSTTRMPGVVTIRDNVIVNGGLTAFGCPEAQIVGNYVHQPHSTGNNALVFAECEMRDNVFRGASWVSTQIGGTIADNLFISLPMGESRTGDSFNDHCTHEHICGLKANSIVERNIFVGGSYGAIMGLGAATMSDSIIRHNTIDMYEHGRPVYMNHLVKSDPVNIEIYNNIFMRCDGITSETPIKDSTSFIDNNLWSDTVIGKGGRYAKVAMTGKALGDVGFAAGDVPATAQGGSLPRADVVVNSDIEFPFSDEDMLTRKHTVTEVLTAYRVAYAPKPDSAAINAGILRNSDDAAVTDGKPDIGAVEHQNP